ncbi:TMEM165/GDT1 family protein [Nostoc sp. FACHB-87]|uniref:TMEM165/GDT1 family protein n=1 Tax=Nostocales TaxID=1161 RepID=UPI001685A9EA|nr:MULTISPECIES: TMEM165/GDT1 family protein [Nostocales]MBD2302074.1 TMEM165/GDT1 family protein [Nostoc sp. FACHB-190]MBD2457396.1 TMEM165/GDT1 family protein [Nostoc sp. FACHB-87]MBD2476644.1 TMEM165/GDT1 family protein [Anabaena sp. FACHB-83]MBD2486425.1 TMEM165/GDT1 family protein [Aulosira sp. FACHB-615]
MLTAFTAGLLLITVSELGDKTFFIAVILSMHHSRRLVFAGVTAALAAMTILSVVFGQAASLLPKVYIHYAEIALFIAFGIKLLYDASKMTAASCDTDVVEEAEAAVKKADAQLPKRKTPWAIVTEAFLLTFMAEWGDRTQIATIALAAGNNPIGVTVGAVLGHSICAAIAVLGGKLIAGRISERQLTFIGGCLFLIFGVVAAVEGA